MALKGQAAVAIWSDMQDPAAHDDWHSHEHLIERLGIPGFLRARRTVCTEAGAARYFVLYEVADGSVMTSPAYLRCLNNPSAWTTRTMATNQSLNRTLCTVAFTAGQGMGGLLLALPLRAQPEHASALHTWLIDTVLPGLPQQPGLTGAHLLVRAVDTQRPHTQEEHLRGRPDGSVDAVVLVEGYDADVLTRLARTVLTESALAARGAAGPHTAHVYRMAHHMDGFHAHPSR
jgi:hypothetical protein